MSVGRSPRIDGASHPAPDASGGRLGADASAASAARLDPGRAAARERGLDRVDARLPVSARAEP